jgi:2-dehydropantoate 2-reductase
VIDRLLVWGSGAVGASVGAALIETGLQVAFVDNDVDHVGALRAGLRVEGLASGFDRPVKVFLPSEVEGAWSCILLAVKAQHTRRAARMLAPHLAPDGCVVSLQNGLVAHDVADEVGAERTLPGFVNFGADVVAPGHISFGNRGTVRVGPFAGTTSCREEEVAALLRLFEPGAQATDDVWSFLWSKLAYATLLYAQATGRAGIADCLTQDALLPLWRALVGEVLAVAQADRVPLRAFDGFDPDAFGPQGSDDAARRSVAAIAAFYRSSSKTHSGIWRDLALRRRSTEVEAHYGPVLARAARHGIACATLGRLVAMIRAIESGVPQDDVNPLRLLESADA